MPYSITADQGYHSGGWAMDQAYDIAADLAATGWYLRILVREEAEELAHSD